MCSVGIPWIRGIDVEKVDVDGLRILARSFGEHGLERRETSLVFFEGIELGPEAA